MDTLSFDPATATQSPTLDAYLTRYADRTIILKASGRELTGISLSHIVQAVRTLVAHRVRVILVYGGGSEIDERCRLADIPRPKSHQGIHATSPAMMEQAVLPAYQAISSTLSRAFQGMPHRMLTPMDVSCSLVPGADRVGHPETVYGHGGQLSMVGFVGNTSGMLVNVNADDIVARIVEQSTGPTESSIGPELAAEVQWRRTIAECIFVTSDGELRDRDARSVRCMSRKKLIELVEKGSITRGTQTLHVDGGMYKKCVNIEKTLRHIPKVALTKASTILLELGTVEGAGVLFVDVDRGVFVPMASRDIFDAVVGRQVSSGCWRERSRGEVDRLYAHHTAFTVGESILGGYSLIADHPIRTPAGTVLGCLIEGFWSDAPGNGIGTKILHHAQERAGDHMLLAYSRSPIFEQAGFTRVEGVVSITGASLWRWTKSV